MHIKIFRFRTCSFLSVIFFSYLCCYFSSTSSLVTYFISFLCVLGRLHYFSSTFETLYKLGIFVINICIISACFYHFNIAVTLCISLSSWLSSLNYILVDNVMPLVIVYCLYYFILNVNI